MVGKGIIRQVGGAKLLIGKQNNKLGKMQNNRRNNLKLGKELNQFIALLLIWIKI